MTYSQTETHMVDTNNLAKPSKTDQVAVVIPTHKKTLCAYEKKAIASIKNTLKNIDLYVVYPNHVELAWDTHGFHHIRLSKQHFLHWRTYNHMCLDPGFYKHFASYDYILICQTDVILLKNDLMAWCQHGYSYIGAPWAQRKFSIIKNSLSKRLFNINLRHSSQHHKLGPVGNGGLSLRKVNDCIAMLNQKVSLKKIIAHTPWLIKQWSFINLCHLYWIYFTKKPKTIGKLFRALAIYPHTHRTRGEDVMFHILNRLYPSFTMPPPERAAQFAVENIILHDFLPEATPLGAHGKHFFEKTPESTAFYERYQHLAPFDANIE